MGLRVHCVVCSMWVSGVVFLSRARPRARRAAVRPALARRVSRLPVPVFPCLLLPLPPCGALASLYVLPLRARASPPLLYPCE